MMSLMALKRKAGLIASSPRRVALILDTAGAVGRQLLEGITRYVQARDLQWLVHFELGMAEDAPGLRRWQGDGIIARVRTPAVEAALRDFDVPKVLDRRLAPVEGHRSPVVKFLSTLSAGKVAFEHLAERGFRHLAFSPLPDGQGWDRLEQFQEAVESAGPRFHFHPPPEPASNHAEASDDELAQRLTAWITALPKPVGIYAVVDLQGYRVLEACRAAGYRVPDDVAVLGNDDDELVWALCTPRLSSVDLHTRERGYRAAAALDALMNGMDPDRALAVAPQAHVVVRGSTDAIFVGDQQVRNAVAYIRDHACEKISVADVLKQTTISRRALERRFHQALRRSPAEEIRRVQISEAKRLLATTEFQMPEIALRCGLANASRLTVAFKRVNGVTPTAFRRQARILKS